MGDLDNLITERQGIGLGSRSNVAVNMDVLKKEIELYKYLAEAKSNKQLLTRALDLIQRQGFTDFAHIMLRPDDVRQNVIVYPRKEHGELRLFREDLMIEHALRSDRPLFASQVRRLIENQDVDTELFAINRYIHEAVRKFKIYDYYHVAFPAYNGGARTLFTIGAKHADPKAFQEKIAGSQGFLNMLGRVMDRVGSARLNLHEIKRRDIRESKCLEVLRVLGTYQCTNREAADRLAITEDMVNAHIRYAKERLGARSTIGAILIAQQLGLIHIKMMI